MAELVANAIKEQIVRGELPAGAMLPPESTLMTEFGVSRPTLREAFRVLEAEGLLVVQRGVHGGARVQPPTAEVAARYAGLLLQYKGTPAADVYDVRAVLEVPCAAGLARTHTQADIERLRRRIKEAEEAGTDPDRQVAVHVAFHADLVELSGNETLILLHQIVNQIIDKDYSSRARTDGQDPEWQHFGDVTMEVHGLLIDMIEAGDVSGAEGLWRRHLADGALYALGSLGRSRVLDIL
ncbi:FadR family transcriptional regulator [Mycolicibacterium pulveris]|nr:FCD domain-containing protein [Mycolicibacterium pulveris]MCV6983847.1 FadR family transcriptional regulator [Mycolicibacterium pulveris]